MHSNIISEIYTAHFKWMPRNCDTFMFPTIKDQLTNILSRPDIRKVLWDHLDHVEIEGYLSDIYDGSKWKNYKERQVPDQDRLWFVERGHIECAFILNRFKFS
jgi:hypothetical protein